MRLVLTTCEVRSWRTADAEPLARYADNRKIWLNLRDAFRTPTPFTTHATSSESLRNRTPETTFAIDVGGEAVGSVGFVLRHDVERVSAEIGYWLGEPFWGRGVATEALAAVTEYAITAHGLTRIYALPFAWNAASCRVLEKAGLPPGSTAAAQRDQERRHHRSAAVRLHRAGDRRDQRSRSAATRKPRLKPLSCGACV